MTQKLLLLSNELEQQFVRWEHCRVNGGSDPFWSDGFNMNLIRNHIIYTKNQIKDLIERHQNGEPSLFPPVYPDIWHKETPPEFPENYMAKADGIRSHAQAQLELFLADPNFQYLKQQVKELYSRGQTQETKDARLPYYEVIGLEKYEKDVDEDNLVAMRRDFREPYGSLAPRWAKYANQIRRYLEDPHNISHNQSDNKPSRISLQNISSPNRTPQNLNSKIEHAALRSAESKPKPDAKQQDKQLTLF